MALPVYKKSAHVYGNVLFALSMKCPIYKDFLSMKCPVNKM